MQREGRRRRSAPWAACRILALLAWLCTPVPAAQDTTKDLDELDKEAPSDKGVLDRGEEGEGWRVELRWVPSDTPGRTLDGLWREDDSLRGGQAIVVVWPTEGAGFRGKGVTPVKGFDDAPAGSRTLKEQTASGVWKLEDGTYLLFPGRIPFKVTDQGVTTGSKEVIRGEEKGQEFFAVKTYLVILEFRNARGELTPFGADLLKYDGQRVLPSFQRSSLTAKVFLPRSDDPDVPYVFGGGGQFVKFNVGPEGVTVVESSYIVGTAEGNVLTISVPAGDEPAPPSRVGSLARPFEAVLGREVKQDLPLKLSTRIWEPGRNLEIEADGQWEYEFSLSDPRGRHRAVLKVEPVARGRFALTRPAVDFTLGALGVTARKAGPGGDVIVVSGTIPLFLTAPQGPALCLLKPNMGRQFYMAGEEIELRLLGTNVKNGGNLEISCAPRAIEADRRSGAQAARAPADGLVALTPVEAARLNDRPLVLGLDTTLLSPGAYSIQARLGQTASNTIDVTLVENSFESDYLTLCYFKYPDVDGSTSPGLIEEMAGRGVNTIISNHDGRGPSFDRPASLAAAWEALDPRHELPGHCAGMYVAPDPVTAAMDLCTLYRVNYFNYGQPVNWCIFGHREDEAEWRRTIILRAYQIREFPSFVGMHYTDCDMPCRPGQGLTGGPAWHSDARAGWRLQEFNRRFDELHGKAEVSLGNAVTDEALSKVSIDRALDLAASAQFSQNPKAREEIETGIRNLDRTRAYFRAYHLIWGDEIGGKFRNDIRAISPDLLVGNASNNQYPDYYFNSFDFAVNSLITDFGIVPLQNWSEGELLRMGRVKKKLSFDAVRPFIVHFDRYVFESLARQFDCIGYDFSNVGTMGWSWQADWRRRSLYTFTLLARYGSTLSEARPKNEVVILDSETMAAADGAMHPTIYYRAHYALTRGGIPAHFATEADLVEGCLEGQAALLLVHQRVPLPSGVLEAIDNFAAAGGRVYYDLDTIVRLPRNARQLDVRFSDYRGFGFDGTSEHIAMDAESVPRGKKLAAALRKDIAFDFVVSNPFVLVRMLHGPDVEYLIAVAEPTSQGHSVQHGWPGHRETIALRERPGRVVDLIEWESVPSAADGSFVADFGAYTARLYALLPERIATLSVELEEGVRLGRENRLRIRPLFASGKPVLSPVPVEVIVRLPGGGERHHLFRTVSAEKPLVSFALAENDPRGTYEVEVTELVTGVRVSGQFDVAAKDERPRLRPFEDVVIYDAEQIARFLKESNGIEVALDFRQRGLRDLAEAWALRLREAGRDVSVRTVRESECVQYPSRWWYDKDELEPIEAVESGRAIGVRTRGKGLNGTFKEEADNFRTLHVETVTRLKYKRNLVLLNTCGNWLYQEIATMLTYPATESAPGKGQATAQMIWAPFDADYNALVVLARDRAGVEKAFEALAALAAGRPPAGVTVARPTPRLAHPRLVSRRPRSAASREASKGRPPAFLPLRGPRTDQAEDNGVVKPSAYPIYHLFADGDGRLHLTVDGATLALNDKLELLWKKSGMDVLQGPIAGGRFVARRGGCGFVLAPDFSAYLRLAESVPFAVSRDGRIFAQRKNNTFAWAPDGELLWKKGLVGEALTDPKVFRAEARHVAVDAEGRYVAASKAWTKEEHAANLAPYLFVREARTGKLLWWLPIFTTHLQFSNDGARLMVVAGGQEGTTTILALDPATGKIVWQGAFTGGSGATAVNPTGTQAAGAVGGTRLRSVSPEAELNWALDTTSVIRGIEFSPDGERLAYTTIDDLVVVLDKRGSRTGAINCSGQPGFAWKSNDEIFFASERGHIGTARPDGTVLSKGSYSPWLKWEDQGMGEAGKLVECPSLFDQPFLDAVRSLAPVLVSVGWEGEAPKSNGDAWPTARLEKERALKVGVAKRTEHQRTFLLFRARAMSEGGSLETVVAQGERRVCTQRFAPRAAWTEYVIGLSTLANRKPGAAEPVVCTFRPKGVLEIAGPVLAVLPFEHPNLARAYTADDLSANPGLNQSVQGITMMTEVRCIGREECLPAAGEHLKLLDGQIYDTAHWLEEKLLTVHDYVKRRKSTSVVDFGSPIPVEICLRRPAALNCLIAYHVPGEPDSVTADMAVQVWDLNQKAWRLLAYREDNHDPTTVFAFETVPTDKVRYWMLATGNGKYGVSEIELFESARPDMDSIDQTGGEEKTEPKIED